MANAALDGARVEPSGSVDLQSLLQPRLQRVDQDLAALAQAAGAATPATASTPGPTQVPQQVIVNQRGPSFVADFLIWMWLTNSGFYRGPSVIINNPPSSSSRSGDSTYYSPPPTTSGTNPSTVASSQAASRARAGSVALGGLGSVVGNRRRRGRDEQVGGGSGGCSAATAKAATVAGAVSAASTGKSSARCPGAPRARPTCQSERRFDVSGHARHRRFVQLERAVVVELERPKLVVQLVEWLRQQQWQQGH